MPRILIATACSYMVLHLLRIATIFVFVQAMFLIKTSEV